MTRIACAGVLLCLVALRAVIALWLCARRTSSVTRIHIGRELLQHPRQAHNRNVPNHLVRLVKIYEFSTYAKRDGVSPSQEARNLCESFVMTVFPTSDAAQRLSSELAHQGASLNHAAIVHVVFDVTTNLYNMPIPNRAGGKHGYAYMCICVCTCTHFQSYP